MHLTATFVPALTCNILYGAVSCIVRKHGTRTVLSLLRTSQGVCDLPLFLLVYKVTIWNGLFREDAVLYSALKDHAEKSRCQAIFVFQIDNTRMLFLALC